MTTLETETGTDEVSGWMFFRSLKVSGLLTPEEIEQLEHEAQTVPLGRIRQMLLQEGILNDYQMRRILDAEAQGLVMGQYRILGEIGAGGCGQVYKARHNLMERIVALKVIGPELLKNRNARDIFLREVIASTRLSHPNIATAYDANEHEGKLFFVMEYIEGTTLDAYVEARGPMPIPLACTVMLETAMALQHAHEKGLVHRDIKPANLILRDTVPMESSSTESTSLVKVVDFGLARIGQLDGRILTTIPCHEGGLIGTPAFIAPEQIRDSHVADIRSDLYSLGCTLYFALSGTVPFRGATSEATLYLHLEAEPESLKKCRPTIPTALVRIIQRLMSKKPSQRYQTPNELIDALNGLIFSGELCENDSGPDIRPAAVLRPLAALVNQHETSVVPLLQPVPATPDTRVQLSPEQALSLWQRWHDVLQSFVAGQQVPMSESQYRMLYRELRSAIQTMTQTDPDRRHCWLAMQHLVEPWVTAKSMIELPPKMLKDLAARGDEIDRDFRPLSMISQDAAWSLPRLLAGCAILGLIAFALIRYC